MLPRIIKAVISFAPSIIDLVEGLINKPKSGAEKLDAYLSLAKQALGIAGIIDPAHIGDAETQLLTDVANAIVRYNNAKGIFKTT